jgi:DNA-binding transcriptional ArsR family regulator
MTVRFESEVWQRGFTNFPNVVLRDARRSMGARMTWVMLAAYAWGSDTAFPGQERLGEDLGVGERQVRRHLKELEDAGLLRIEQRGLGMTNLYRLIVPGPDKYVRSDRTSPPVQERTDMSDKEDSVEEDSGKEGHHLLPSEQTSLLGNTDDSLALPGGKEVRTNFGRKIKVDGKKVERATVALGEAALDEFCRLTGRKLRPYTGSGKPSPALTRILTKLVETPGLDEGGVRRIVRNVVANPPGWVEGKIEVGHIFGPNAWEHSLENEGKKTPDREAEYQARRREQEEELASFHYDVQ